MFSMHSLQLYQNGLLSGLIKPRPHRAPFGTLEDVVELIQTKQAILDVADPDWFAAQILLQFTEGEEKFGALRRALRRNPPIFGRINPEHVRAAQDRGQLVISISTYEGLLVRYDVAVCDFLIVGTDLQVFQGFMLSPKVNQTTIDCLNRAIVMNLKAITDALQWDAQHKFRVYEFCREQLQKAQNARDGFATDPIRLVRLSGVFVILLVGLIVSFVWFAMEQCQSVFLAKVR